MPDSQIVQPDAVQKVISKTLTDLKPKLSQTEFSAMEMLAADGRILDIEEIMSIVHDDPDDGDEQ